MPNKAKIHRLPAPELCAITDLKPHPRNYRKHPADQIAHLAASLREHGQYRNIVVAKEGTILAGHGVVEAAKSIPWKELLIIRLNLAPTSAAAMKILLADNEIAHLGEVDDRMLTDMLKELRETGDLLGTGYDEQMLAALLLTTRTAGEIAGKDDANQWVGMPVFENDGTALKLVVSFESEATREEFCRAIGLQMKKKLPGTWSTWWPQKSNDDASAVKFMA